MNCINDFYGSWVDDAVEYAVVAEAGEERGDSFVSDASRTMAISTSDADSYSVDGSVIIVGHGDCVMNTNRPLLSVRSVRIRGKGRARRREHGPAIPRLPRTKRLLPNDGNLFKKRFSPLTVSCS